MKLPKKERSQLKRNLIIAGTLVLIAGVVLVVLEKNGVINLFGQQGASGPTQQQKAEQAKTDASQKESFLNSSTTNSSTDKSNTGAGSAQPATPPSSSDSITVSAKQQNTNIIVTAKLTGQGYASGTCKLTATTGSKTTSQTADIIYQPEYSTCAGFSVPVGALGSGVWTIKLDVTPTGGSVLTQSTTITVQ